MHQFSNENYIFNQKIWATSDLIKTLWWKSVLVTIFKYLYSECLLDFKYHCSHTHYSVFSSHLYSNCGFLYFTFIQQFGAFYPILPSPNMWILQIILNQQKKVWLSAHLHLKGTDSFLGWGILIWMHSNSWRWGLSSWRWRRPCRRGRGREVLSGEELVLAEAVEDLEEMWGAQNTCPQEGYACSSALEKTSLTELWWINLINFPIESESGLNEINVLTLLSKIKVCAQKNLHQQINKFQSQILKS